MGGEVVWEVLPVTKRGKTRLHFLKLNVVQEAQEQALVRHVEIQNECGKAGHEFLSVGRQDVSSSYGSTKSQLLQSDRVSELPPVWNELEYKLQIYCEGAKLVLSEEDHRVL